MGVFLLMAVESSVIPLPSEIVMPPAAYWASQGKMDFWGVVLAGTLGSYVGSAINYIVSRFVGTPLLFKYGKYFFLPPKKLKMAEVWLMKYGVFGIFTARLLPVIRHLISIPAGLLEMKFSRFSTATLSGAFLWCMVLSFFGQKVIGNNPELLSSPETLITVCKQQLHWFLAAVLIVIATYAFVMRFHKKHVVESVN